MTPENAKKAKLAALTIAALGVVFGDIGTSPLYAFNTSLQIIPPGNTGDIIALASLIVWALIFIVTVKYIFLVMRTDYHGEGGIFALYAIVRKAKLPHSIWTPLSFILLIGAALLYGDGTITPAISVLSAVSGLQTIDPNLTRWVIPITIVILLGLFSIQRFGTGKLGGLFGYVMLVWFISIGLMGLFQIIREPQVLAALLPWKGLFFILAHPHLSLIVLGAVVLAVTGAEALYADLGHFGRPAIALAWHSIALPGLLLNYLGQAAAVIHLPELHTNPNLFYMLTPEGPLRISMVLLATVTTVIASQALISGIFSLTSQAIDLNYLPRFAIFHTSSSTRGQIYMPAVNWLLAAVCLLLVITFGSSDALAGAYGLAVTGTMICTTIGFGFVLHYEKAWKISSILPLCGFFFLIEFGFLLSCFGKLATGGYVPVILGIGMISVMTTWKLGRRLIRKEVIAQGSPPAEFAKWLAEESIPRVPGTIVFVARRPDGILAVAVAKEHLRRTGAIQQNIVILTLDTVWTNARCLLHEMKVQEFENGVSHVQASYGYMIVPNAPALMAEANLQAGGRLLNDPENTFYVLFREVIYEGSGHPMATWRRNLFSWLSRNVQPAQNYLSVPSSQIVEFNWMIHL
ncbi:MAG: KUP/HAK/KT family potassium transporter [Chthoniobacterales bacterium]